MSGIRPSAILWRRFRAWFSGRSGLNSWIPGMFFTFSRPIGPSSISGILVLLSGANFCSSIVLAYLLTAKALSAAAFSAGSRPADVISPCSRVICSTIRLALALDSSLATSNSDWGVMSCSSGISVPLPNLALRASIPALTSGPIDPCSPLSLAISALIFSTWPAKLLKTLPPLLPLVGEVSERVFIFWFKSEKVQTSERSTLCLRAASIAASTASGGWPSASISWRQSFSTSVRFLPAASASKGSILVGFLLAFLTISPATFSIVGRRAASKTACGSLALTSGVSSASDKPLCGLSRPRSLGDAGWGLGAGLAALASL
jgi:hypothetical protein